METQLSPFALLSYICHCKKYQILEVCTVEDNNEFCLYC